jgi:hypothetical protein
MVRTKIMVNEAATALKHRKNVIESRHHGEA